MNLTREGLCYIASTFYQLMLWSSNFTPLIMHPTNDKHFIVVPNPKHHHYFPDFGLKNTLTNVEKPHSQILHSSTIRTSTSLSSSSSLSSYSSLFSQSTINSAWSQSSWSSSLTGDLIGTESGVYTSPVEDIVVTRPCCGRKMARATREQRQKKEYPPPIRSLLRPDDDRNLRGCRMAHVFTRHVVDGRLVIKMVKVRRRVYFKTDRCNGRLILKLVPLDNKYHVRYDNANEEEDDEDGLLDVERKRVMSSFACSVPKSARRSGKLWGVDDEDKIGRMCFSYAAERTTCFRFGGTSDEGNISARSAFDRIIPRAASAV